MTRAKLVEFIRETRDKINRTGTVGDPLYCLADALISEGFVKVDEPREFWILSSVWSGGKSILTVVEEEPKIKERYEEIIHVKECLEDSHDPT